MVDLRLEVTSQRRVRSRSLGQDSTLNVLIRATVYGKHLSLFPALLPFIPFSSSPQGNENALLAKVLEMSETCSVLLHVRTEPVGKRLADGSQEQCAIL